MYIILQKYGDDATVSTPSRGSKAKPKGSNFKEITLKSRFSTNERHDTVTPEVLHLHWIQIVHEVFDFDIQGFNNNQRGANSRHEDVLDAKRRN